jgi:hypothetical protein
MRIKRFNSFNLNEEISLGIFGNRKQEKIKQYTESILFNRLSGGNFRAASELRELIDKYINAVRYGTSISNYKKSIQNLQDILRDYSFRDKAIKNGSVLKDSEGNERPGEDVIEEEVARVILKSLKVKKEDGKWKAIAPEKFKHQWSDRPR